MSEAVAGRAHAWDQLARAAAARGDTGPQTAVLRQLLCLRVGGAPYAVRKTTGQLHVLLER